MLTYGPRSIAQKPSWVYPWADYDLDYSGNRYHGSQMWLGSGNSATRAQSAMVGSNSGANAGTLFTQWKDGILRPSKSQYELRISDYGLWVEGGQGAANNYALWCRDFTNAVWSKTSLTAAKTSVGADAVASSASRLTATADNGTALQSITLAGGLDVVSVAQGVASGGTGVTLNDMLTLSGGTFTTAAQVKATAVSGGTATTLALQTVGSYSVLPSNPVTLTGGSGSGVTLTAKWKQVTVSAWIRRVTGTGTVSLSADNGATWTDITSQINSSTYKQVRIPTMDMANPVVGVKLGTSGDAIDIDFFQCENDDQATSPILTTSATNIRGQELAAFGTTGVAYNDGLRILKDLYYGTPVTFLVQYSGNFSTRLKHLILGTDGNNMPFSSGSAGGGTLTVNGNTGSLVSDEADVSGLFTLNKVCIRLDGNSLSICINGGAIKTTTASKYQATAQVLTHGGLLNNGSNILPTNGYVKRWSGGKVAITDGEMRELTTLIPGEG